MDHLIPPTPPPPPPFAAAANTKLRLMCSYGGNIIPRPNFNSLCYCGGETRIVAVDHRTTNTVDQFIAHISATLMMNQPFTVKYQIPHHDLDALITIATDEDLLLMFDEHDRLVDSPTPSRLRLFLFPVKQPPPAPKIPNSPTDSWFSDALKSAKIMRKMDGLSDQDTAACVEGGGEGLMQESLMLDTSSSFGSTSSSSSSAILPKGGGAHADEAVGMILQENKINLMKSDLIFSDSFSGVPQARPGTNQDRGFDVSCVDSKPSSPHIELLSNIPPPPPPQAYTQVPVSGYPFSAPLPHPQQQQQQIQITQSSSPYHYPIDPLPISPDPTMYHTHTQLHYPTQYQQNHTYPNYMVQVSQPQPTYMATSQPLMHSNVAMMQPQMVATPPPLVTSNVFRGGRLHQPPQQIVGRHHGQPLPVPIKTNDATITTTAVTAPAGYNLMYKTQPPPPPLPPQFPPFSGAAAAPMMLSKNYNK